MFTFKLFLKMKNSKRTTQLANTTCDSPYTINIHNLVLKILVTFSSLTEYILFECSSISSLRTVHQPNYVEFLATFQQSPFLKRTKRSTGNSNDCIAAVLKTFTEPCLQKEFHERKHVDSSALRNPAPVLPWTSIGGLI